VPGAFASPPCSLHELDPSYSGLEIIDQQTRTDVTRWRKAERSRLLKSRLARPAHWRATASNAIGTALWSQLDLKPGCVISMYWPIAGEPDLRPWAGALRASGAHLVLPVVTHMNQAMAFRQWLADAPMKPGIWNIPIPSTGEWLVPDIVLAPVVGFDSSCFRLGNGGGYFDRTLVELTHRPQIIGIGFELAAIDTIFPFEHDVPMHAVVTEQAVHTTASDSA